MQTAQPDPPDDVSARWLPVEQRHIGLGPFLAWLEDAYERLLAEDEQAGAI